MLGAIIGDVIGSPYEFESHKTKDFELMDTRIKGYYKKYVEPLYGEK